MRVHWSKVKDFLIIFISYAPADVSYYVLDLFTLNALYVLYYVNRLQYG
jgi:hypothetical protein